MKYAIILVLLFASLLALGCAAPPVPKATPTSGPAATVAATIAPTAAATATPAPTVSQANAGGLPTTVLAAMALGIPHKCRVSIKDIQTGMIVNGEMWIKGQNYRFESTTSVTGDKKMVSVKRGDDVFLGGIQDGLWLKVSTKAGEDSGGTPASAGITADEIEQAKDLQCAPEVFGDDKFATPGTVKTMEEYLRDITGGSLPSGLPSGIPSLPAGIPGYT